jgi:hypothetical protein
MLGAFGTSTASDLARLAASYDARSWSSDNPGFVDFSIPFDSERVPVMPLEWFVELRTPLSHSLATEQRIRLGNEIIRWLLSGILHGERAAAALSRQLYAIFSSPAARACMANQAREEDRHSAAFEAYLRLRWRAAHPAGDAFERFCRYLLATDNVEHKVVGMCVLVEGFAMGALSNIRAHTKDAVLARILALVLRDESAHHAFGTLWLQEKSKSATEHEWIRLCQFARWGFEILRVNLLSIRQRRHIYANVGVDWRAMREAVRQGRKESPSGHGLEASVNPLGVVATSLLRAGLVRDADRPHLRQWLNERPTPGKFHPITD